MISNSMTPKKAPGATPVHVRLDPRRGQSLVEFALLLPLLIVMLFAIIDFGYYLFVMVAVNQATRAGTRRAAMNTADCATIKKAVTDAAVGVGMNASEITVTAVANDASLAKKPPTVTVSVSHNHRMFAASLYQFDSLPVTSSYKSIVTTFTGTETVTFPVVGGGTCP